MQLQEKKSPIFDHDFPAPQTGVPSPCIVRGSILDRTLPASVGLDWNCGEPSHSFLRSIRKHIWGGVGFHKKLVGPSDSKRNLRLIRIIGRKKTKKHKIDNTCNLLPELVDDLSGRCDVLEKEASVMCVDDTEEFMWIDHRQAPCEVLGSRCL